MMKEKRFSFKRVGHKEYQCNEEPKLILFGWYCEQWFWDYLYNGNCLNGSYYTKKEALNVLELEGLEKLIQYQ